MLVSLFKNVACLKACKVIKKKFPTQVLSCEIWKKIYLEEDQRKATCNNNYIVTISALDFKQVYAFYKFGPIKETFLCEIIRYLVEKFNC